MGSSLDEQLPPRLRNAQTNEDSRRSHGGDTSEDPRSSPVQIVRIRAQYSTSRGSSNQDGDADHGKAHANPRTNPRLVLGELDVTDGRQSEEDAREEAIESGDHNQTRGVLDRQQTKHQDTNDERAGRDHVQRAGDIGQGIRYRSAKDTRGVEDGHEIETHLLVGVARGLAVVADVKEHDVQPDKADHGSEREDHIRHVGEGGPVDQRARLGRLDALLEDGERHQQRAERDEREDAHRPAEADLVDELVEDDGIDNTAHAGPCGREPDGQPQPRGEVRRQDRDARHEEAAGAQPDAEALRQQRLPKGLGQRQHHEAEDDAEGPQQQQQAQIAAVVDGACHAADGQDQERLDAPDPGDIGRRRGEQRPRLVVCLEDAEGVQQPEGVEEQAEAAGDL